MATNNIPANQLRCGNIKATIWQNVSEKGPFFSTTFSRPFKDQSGEGATEAKSKGSGVFSRQCVHRFLP